VGERETKKLTEKIDIGQGKKGEWELAWWRLKVNQGRTGENSEKDKTPKAHNDSKPGVEKKGGVSDPANIWK